MNPLVSVIIPAYNAEKTLIRCLGSVLNQTYKNLEVIVIDDGSEDLTLQLLQNYSNEHPGLNLQFYSISNSGPASARNYGIARSCGEYIAFLDSDDCWAPQKIERQIECFMEQPNIDMLCCESSFKAETYKKGEKAKCQIVSKYQLLLKNYFPTSSIIIKRAIFQTLMFEEKQKYSEDYYLWLQIAFNNKTCAVLKEKLYIPDNKPKYGHSGLSGNLWKMEKGDLNNYTKLFRKKIISPHWYIISICFSLIKYIKRVLVTFFRRFKLRKNV